MTNARSTGHNHCASSGGCSGAQQTIQLIRGGPEHLAELQQVWLRWAGQMEDGTPSIGRALPSDSWDRAAEDHRISLSHAGSVLLLARRGGELIGYALVAVRYSGSLVGPRARHAYLDYLVALNRETLIALVTEATRRVHEARLDRLWITLDPSGNRAFYAELGFVVEQVTMWSRVDPEGRGPARARRHRRGRRGGRSRHRRLT